MSDTPDDDIGEQLFAAADDLAGILASPYGTSVHLKRAKKHLTAAWRAHGQDPKTAFGTPHMQQPFKLDFLWAGLCLVGAVSFMFRS